MRCTKTVRKTNLIRIKFDKKTLAKAGTPIANQHAVPTQA
jgi:hypothetical protein